MSGRARLALCAAAATLLAACALLPLVDPATWLVQAAFLLAIQTGGGRGGPPGAAGPAADRGGRRRWSRWWC